MKLKEYNVFGDKNEYCDITFQNDKEDEIKMSIYNKTNRITIECEDVNIDDVRKVMAMIESGKLEIEL